MSRYPFNPETFGQTTLIENDGVDPSATSPEEFKPSLEDFDEEPQRIPFSSFPLCTNEGRKAFLEEYIFWGAERLFEAVGHIWDSLSEPKGGRCIGIGIAAGTGGTGKLALAKFLNRSLRAALDYEVPMPSPQPGGSLDDFQRSAMAYFAGDRDHYEKAIQTYADILAGEPAGPDGL